MTPVAMVGDTDIACQDFRCRRFFDGYGQLLYAVGRSDPAAVAEGLFPVVLAGFELYGIEGIQFAIVADRRQIGGGKADDTHIAYSIRLNSFFRSLLYQRNHTLPSIRVSGISPKCRESTASSSLSESIQ